MCVCFSVEILHDKKNCIFQQLASFHTFEPLISLVELSLLILQIRFFTVKILSALRSTRDVHRYNSVAN